MLIAARLRSPHPDVPKESDMTALKITLATALALAASTLSATAAEHEDADGLAEEIVSPVAEGEEDCEALRESLRRQRDDNRLNPGDLRELRDKGC